MCRERYIHIYIYRERERCIDREREKSFVAYQIRDSLNRGSANRGLSEPWKCALRSCENLCSRITKPGFPHPGKTFVRSP